MLTDFIEELFVLGEQLFEPKGLELCLGLAAEGLQRLFDQGVITDFIEEIFVLGSVCSARYDFYTITMLTYRHVPSIKCSELA